MQSQRKFVSCKLTLTPDCHCLQVWWYKRGHLAENKVWFLLLIYTVMIVQCATSSIYVFVRDEGSLSPN